MSILSDSELLFNHIKNSFIFGDDTGICELIIDKDFPSNFNIKDILNNQLSFPIVDTSSYAFRSSSPEIPLTSNKTSIKKMSEIRIKEVVLNESKISVDHQFIDTGEWPRLLTENDINEYFNEVKCQEPRKSSTSLLSKMLKETDKADVASANIFSQFARFSAFRYTKSVCPTDSSVVTNQVLVCENDTMRDFHIYFWDFEEQRDRSNPVIVRPILGTKVLDLIGLACWKYVDENRYPSLTNPTIVNKLQLYMFEDIDDLEMGFGSLNGTDPIYKYQFSHLAILECQRNGRSKFVSVCSNTSDNSFVTQSHVEKMGLRQKSITEIDSFTDRNSISSSSDTTDGSILVQIQLAHGLSKFRFSPNTTVEKIIQHTVNKRHLLEHGESYKYRLELASAPGKELDLNITLNQIENSNFVLVRDMSRRKPAIPDVINDDTSVQFSKLIDSLQPQNYNVYLKQPLKRWEATLSVSQDMIEIESIAGKLSFKIKPKAIRIPICLLAHCEINFHGQNQSDISSKVTIKLTHLKKKSPLSTSLKGSSEYDAIASESETSSIWSHTRNERLSQNHETMMNNLLSELTSHSISCQSAIGNLIYTQIMSIMNYKDHFIRKQYMKLLV